MLSLSILPLLNISKLPIFECFWLIYSCTVRAKAVCLCFCFHFSLHTWFLAQHDEEDGLSFSVCWICRKEKRLILCPILSNIRDLHQAYRNFWLGFSIIYSSQMPSQSFFGNMPNFYHFATLYLRLWINGHEFE